MTSGKKKFIEDDRANLNEKLNFFFVFEETESKLSSSTS